VNSDTVVLFLSLLALFAQVAIVVTVVALVVARAAPMTDAIVQFCRESGTLVAFCVAAVATVGSLYLSEGANFVPCRLCWYQRIAMYPLTVVLAVALIARRRDAHFYVMPIAAIGALISIYHVALERIPSLESASVCEAANPCSLIWTNRFGYQTIPTMALTAFALLILVSAIGATGQIDDEPRTRT
jgi:disulfide bond formation protein DsbB